MMNSYKEMTPIQGDHLKSVYSQGFHAFLKAFKLDNNPGNYFPIALSNHNETRNKLDQRFVYNVETNFEKKISYTNGSDVHYVRSSFPLKSNLSSNPP